MIDSLIPYILLAMGLCGTLALFLSVKREIHDILAETQSTSQPEAAASPSVEAAIARALMAEPLASLSGANTGKVA